MFSQNNNCRMFFELTILKHHGTYARPPLGVHGEGSGRNQKEWVGGWEFSHAPGIGSPRVQHSPSRDSHDAMTYCTRSTKQGVLRALLRVEGPALNWRARHARKNSQLFVLMLKMEPTPMVSPELRCSVGCYQTPPGR